MNWYQRKSLRRGRFELKTLHNNLNVSRAPNLELCRAPSRAAQAKLKLKGSIAPPLNQRPLSIESQCLNNTEQGQNGCTSSHSRTSVSTPQLPRSSTSTFELTSICRTCIHPFNGGRRLSNTCVPEIPVSDSSA